VIKFGKICKDLHQNFFPKKLGEFFEQVHHKKKCLGSAAIHLNYKLPSMIIAEQAVAKK
jgi:hypothetical protein